MLDFETFCITLEYNSDDLFEIWPGENHKKTFSIHHGNRDKVYIFLESDCHINEFTPLYNINLLSENRYPIILNTQICVRSVTLYVMRLYVVIMMDTSNILPQIITWTNN